MFKNELKRNINKLQYILLHQEKLSTKCKEDIQNFNRDFGREIDNYIKELNDNALNDMYRYHYKEQEKEYMIDKYGKETIQYWIDNIEMKDLMYCMEAFSNDCFVNGNIKHRDKILNIYEMILNEETSSLSLYASSTYGLHPGNICTNGIGSLTGKQRGNIEIASFLIAEKISDLKKWLLENHKFTEDEKRLLHYFNEE